MSHAFGAAFDNPDLIVATVVGDGEAETGPLATGWHGNKFLNPVRDGAVLPILHLNGYKIANPCFLARIPREELQKLFEGYGYKPHFVEGHEPEKMHGLMAPALDNAIEEIQGIWAEARKNGFQGNKISSPSTKEAISAHTPQPFGKPFAGGISRIRIVISRDDQQARLAAQTPEISLNHGDLNIGVQSAGNVQEITADSCDIVRTCVRQQPIELLQTVMKIGDVKNSHARDRKRRARVAA